ncbi:unnamed protein product [Aureobasidium vineae]|uniref:RING-type domain-containing protein n=1 Tax=Aureobasidium vineae TaxID=2773715 RepID=A0A9N8JGX3_9PEZI|nr:unnamed protein product [Aureobasidium vineae]
MSSSINDNINNQTPEPKSWQACFDSDNTETFVTLPCDHPWCRDCISQVCTQVRNERDWPVICDEGCTIPEEIALETLPEFEATHLKEKLRELKMPVHEHYYCANRDCGEFIATVAIDPLARCGECGCKTYKQCRALEHEGDCEGPSQEDEQALALIKKEGWAECSKCSRVIERGQRCPHMTCYCGYEFYYHCKGPILACNGCGHLEPDNRPAAQAPIAATLRRVQQENQNPFEMIQTSIFSLRISAPPDSAFGLTRWFNDRLHEDGYRGPRVFFTADRSAHFIPGDVPGIAGLEVSDNMLFSLFGTARLEVQPDGTSPCSTQRRKPSRTTNRVMTRMRTGICEGTVRRLYLGVELFFSVTRSF